MSYFHLCISFTGPFHFRQHVYVKLSKIPQNPQVLKLDCSKFAKRVFGSADSLPLKLNKISFIKPHFYEACKKDLLVNIVKLKKQLILNVIDGGIGLR